MKNNIRIAIDAMGGDGGPSIIMPAISNFLNDNKEVSVTAYGDENFLNQYVTGFKDNIIDRLDVVNTQDNISSDESPVSALRNKKKSSMRLAIESVNKKESDACVSAGNTGALMAISKYVLGTLKGIDRPAIETMLPSLKGHTHVLDLGANVDCKAEHLYQFAVMGSVLCMVLDDNESPKVGLLNVGQESIKGNVQVKEADLLLKKGKLNYIGYVEGDEIFCGDVDVVVCDGFIGNIALKTSEGIAKFMGRRLKDEYTKNLFTKIAGVSSARVINSFKKVVDPRRYNGASLLGLKGVIVKSHGGADQLAFECSLEMALKEAIQAVPSCIDSKLEELLR